MQQRVRGRGEAAPSNEQALPEPPGGERPQDVGPGVGGIPGGAGSVSAVPSEQLWRAAVMAAREAALTAAELRRSLEARRAVE